MLTTIAIGSSVLVQGVFLHALADGRVSVLVDGKILSGRPVKAAA